MKSSCALLLISLVGVAVAVEADVDDTKIDKSDKVATEFTWTVTIYSQLAENKVRCGATLISNNWLLTAAQCLRNGTAVASSVRVLIGKDETQDYADQVVIGRSSIIVHPHFGRGGVYNYDVALIKLSVAVPSDNKENIKPVNLPEKTICDTNNYDKATTDDIDGCSAATTLAVGFHDVGLKNESVSSTAVALKAYLQCESGALGTFTNAKLCTSGADFCSIATAGNAVVCLNDKSGNYFVAGVSSYGAGDNATSCGKTTADAVTKPRVYSRVCRVLPWISRITRDEEAAVAAKNIKTFVKQSNSGATDFQTGCSSSPDIHNGIAQGSGSRVGTVRTIICDPGYVLSGADASATCKSDGYWYVVNTCVPAPPTAKPTPATIQTDIQVKVEGKSKKPEQIPWWAMLIMGLIFFPSLILYCILYSCEVCAWERHYNADGTPKA